MLSASTWVLIVIILLEVIKFRNCKNRKQNRIVLDAEKLKKSFDERKEGFSFTKDDK